MNNLVPTANGSLPDVILLVCPLSVNAAIEKFNAPYSERKSKQHKKSDTLYVTATNKRVDRPALARKYDSKIMDEYISHTKVWIPGLADL